MPPVAGRRGPHTRAYPTRKGADCRWVLTVEQSSNVRIFGDVRGGYALHGLKPIPTPRGLPSIGTRWQGMDDDCQNGSIAPPRTRHGGRCKTSRSDWFAPRPTSSWRSDASRRKTREHPCRHRWDGVRHPRSPLEMVARGPEPDGVQAQPGQQGGAAPRQWPAKTPGQTDREGPGDAGKRHSGSGPGVGGPLCSALLWISTRARHDGCDGGHAYDDQSARW
jgi:hypothetical protein